MLLFLKLGKSLNVRILFIPDFDFNNQKDEENEMEEQAVHKFSEYVFF